MNTTKGFIVPIVLVLIALFLAGGGAYVYTQTKPGSQATSTAESATLPQAISTTQIVLSAKPFITYKALTHKDSSAENPQSSQEIEFAFSIPDNATNTKIYVSCGLGLFVYFSDDLTPRSQAPENICNTWQADNRTTRSNPWIRDIRIENLSQNNTSVTVQVSATIDTVELKSAITKFNVGINSIVTPISSTTATVQTSDLKTYSNTKYGFSIQYPCDTQCQSSPPAPYQNAYTENEMWLPTVTSASVILSTFTEGSVKEWNDNVISGPGYPFPFSLSSAREALKLPVNATCKISDYYNADIHRASDCTIVLMNGEKAVQIIEGVFKADYPNKVYLLDRGGNKWLEVIEAYHVSDAGYDFLSDESKATPDIRNQLNAVSEIIKTLKF